MTLTVGSTNVSVTPWGGGGQHREPRHQVLDAATGANVAGAAVNVDRGCDGGQLRLRPPVRAVTLWAPATSYLVSRQSAGGDTRYCYDNHVVPTAAGTGAGAASSTAGSASARTSGGEHGHGVRPAELPLPVTCGCGRH
jgi:hypothetical protein